MLNFLHQLQLLPITQIKQKNLLEWLLYRLHPLRDQLHLTTVNLQNFKLCYQVLPVQSICTKSGDEDEKPKKRYERGVLAS